MASSRACFRLLAYEPASGFGPIRFRHMQGVLSLPDHLAPLSDGLLDALGHVQLQFDRQLHVDLPPVMQLVQHVEHYRGKMLRPTLVCLCGMAAHSKAATSTPGSAASFLAPQHAVLGAVLEMVHMATLVHDDVLDEEVGSGSVGPELHGVLVGRKTKGWVLQVVWAEE